MPKLNIGCGKLYKEEGYINCDISAYVKADKYFDIGKTWPFPNNYAEEILCGCVLEQVHDNKDFINAMNEIWRVLKPDGVLIGYVPNANFPCAFQDPMDCRFFNEETWKYFDYKENAFVEFGEHYGFKPWRDISFATNDSGIMHFSLHPYKK